LSASLSVREIGTTSVSLDILLQGPDGAGRVRGKVVLVWIDRRVTKVSRFPTKYAHDYWHFEFRMIQRPSWLRQGENKP